MFFLITHILIGKYYPSLVTQFIIGCTCYILSFFIIKDIIDEESFNECKYYVLSLIIADVIFIVYKTKSRINISAIKQFPNHIVKENKVENFTTDLKTGSTHSVTLSSEINDFKITHDLSITDPNDENSMFSTSDNEPKIKDKIEIKNRLEISKESSVGNSSTSNDK